MVQFILPAAVLFLVGTLQPVATNAQSTVARCPPKPDPPSATPPTATPPTTMVPPTADKDLMLEERNVVQLGPRPYYLVEEMKDSPLKETLMTCASETKIFEISDFAIGHRGACLQFPEHTKISYEAASILGAGIVECDVTFTKDLELVCRHAQCDLHTTTDVVLRPDMNAKCTKPWSTGVAPTCCASDFTLAEIKTLCAKMDSFNDVNATTPEGYVYGGTADWRTDLHQYGCQEVPTHKESIEIIRANNGKFTPELKSADVKMPYNGFSQEDYAMKMIQEYIDAGVPPEDVWPQSFNLDDVLFWLNSTDYGAQAVALDGDDARPDANTSAYLLMLDAAGVKYVAPPMWRLVEPNPNAAEYEEYDMRPSLYANLVKNSTSLKIITWTLNRAAPPLSGSGNYYWQTLEDKGLNLTEGSNFDLVHVLHSQVGVEGIFDDWPAVTAFYGNCFNIKTRLFR